MLRQVEEVVESAPDVCSVLQGDLPATARPTTLRRGMQGDQVRHLQEALRRKGLNVGLDGVFGSETEAAVREFQASNGLSADGVAGPATWEKLASTA